MEVARRYRFLTLLQLLLLAHCLTSFGGKWQLCPNMAFCRRKAFKNYLADFVR